MLALQLAKTLLLWASVACLWSLAYLRSVSASSFDRRLPWGLPLVLGAHAMGLALVWWLARRPRWKGTRLGADAHALSLIVSALALLAFSHVVPHTSIRVLREEIPPLFAWLPPLLALLTPVALLVTRPRLDVADQALCLTLFLLPLSGAMLLLEGPAALCLASSALALALVSSQGRWPRAPILIPVLFTLGLLLWASAHGLDPLQAAPANSWILAQGAVLLAIACRPRSSSDWRLLLWMPVASATLLACCGWLLTAWLAQAIDPWSALHTRLTLFRQHPNFLAPLFALHAVLAVTLACSARKGRLAACACFAVLAGATWFTDSRAGMALAAIGLAALPVLTLLSRWLGRRSAGWISALVLLGPPLAIVLLTSLGPTLIPDAWTSGIDRFGKSLDYRLDAWSNSATLIEQHPWTGIGPHTFLSVQRFAPGSRFFNAPEAPHPHNVLLYVAQSGGLPALAAFAIWFGWLVFSLLRRVSLARARCLHLGLAGALLALLVANLLDVGLALDTVVPEPVFLATGLVAALAARHAREPVRPGIGLALALVLLGVTTLFGLRPLAAASHLSRAGLLAYQAGQRHNDPELMRRARSEATVSIALDPDRAPAYELLSRWLESTEGGIPLARKVLLDLRSRAPHHGHSAALLGQFYLRAHMDEQALQALQDAVADSHGSAQSNSLRAQIVAIQVRLGRRQDALDSLVDAMGRDIGVIGELPWRVQADSGERWLAVGRPEDGLEPLRLLEAVELLYARVLEQRRAGQPVGRRAWMDLVGALHEAGANDRALAVLDDLEANEPSVERPSIEHERGVIALDQGDGKQALLHFQQAYDMTHNPYFLSQARRARQLLGQAEQDAASPPSGPPSVGEILDQAPAYRQDLLGRAEQAERQAQPGLAAQLLIRSLLFEDDLLRRAELLTRSAELDLSAGLAARASQALQDALGELDAKPFPRSVLLAGSVDSLPARLARDYDQALHQLHLSAPERLARAWSIPSFFRATQAAGLFRCAFYSDVGMPDALLREADLALLIDPDNLLARWSRLEAQEAMGQHAAAAQSMRNISEILVKRTGIDLDQRFQQVVAEGMDRMDDWQAWFDAALVRLLQGRYGEAADLFGKAASLQQEHEGGDPTAARQAARLAGWQARAELFSGREGSLASTRRLLQQAVALAPGVGSLRLRLETLP